MNELEVIESTKGPDEQYPTTNLQTAAVLKTVGHKFKDIRRQESSGGAPRTEFIFAHNDVKETLIQWLNDELRVCPRTLLQNESDLKNLVHNCKWKESEQPRKKRRNRRGRRGKKSEPTDKPGTVGSTEAPVPAG